MIFAEDLLISWDLNLKHQLWAMIANDNLIFGNLQDNVYFNLEKVCLHTYYYIYLWCDHFLGAKQFSCEIETNFMLRSEDSHWNSYFKSMVTFIMSALPWMLWFTQINHKIKLFSYSSIRIKFLMCHNVCKKVKF